MATSQKKSTKHKPLTARARVAYFLKALGFTCLTAGFLIFLLTILPIFKEEVVYSARQALPKTMTEIKPVDRAFGIVIPKLGANAHVVPDVDPYNSAIYQQALARGVAHAKGTTVPTQQGNVFLFSHSSVDFYLATQYNAVFYLLNKLEKGDTIEIYYKLDRYTYTVEEKEIVDADAIDYLTRQTSEKILTLMTCWPPGTSLKRLMVTALLTDVTISTHKE